MFGGGFNDPFGMQNNMNMMMNSMMDPFGIQHQQQMQNHQQNHQQIHGQNHHNQSRNHNRRHHGGDMFGNMAMSPFHQHQSMMSNQMHNPFNFMNQMMPGGGMMNQNIIHASPHSEVFSTQSVVTMSNGIDGKPQIYQQSTETRQGPGGVKETRQLMRDSGKGIEKVSIGHHIGDRAHVIERQKLNGNMEEIVNLENLDDDEIEQFNNEFESKIRHGAHHHPQSHHHHRSHPHSISNNEPFAIEGHRSPPGRHNKKEHRERKPKPTKSKE